LIESTNNVTEREIRTLVLDRMLTQGVRSDWGNEWQECFWTVLATCKRRDWNVLAFLREAIDLFTSWSAAAESDEATQLKLTVNGYNM